MKSPRDPEPAERDAEEEAVRVAKSALRRTVLRRRQERSPAARKADDAARTAVLTRQLAHAPATVAAYLSAEGEPDTVALLGWLSVTGRRVLLPVMTDGTARLLPAPAWGAYEGPDRLRDGFSGILEPMGPVLGPEALVEAQLVVCPGLAGDLRGGRLGRGGGWYDRALVHAAEPANVILLLNDDEVVEVVPTQSWDRRVDVLVTPSGWTVCRVEDR